MRANAHVQNHRTAIMTTTIENVFHMEKNAEIKEIILFLLDGGNGNGNGNSSSSKVRRMFTSV